ncbi:MAG: hypothetical protein KDK89_01110, partial [Alphaproteobacteria bacterium]|nr:hypothetical protein [Alphaproteobacteria bacterium]
TKDRTRSQAPTIRNSLQTERHPQKKVPWLTVPRAIEEIAGRVIKADRQSRVLLEELHRYLKGKQAWAHSILQ